MVNEAYVSIMPEWKRVICPFCLKEIAAGSETVNMNQDYPEECSAAKGQQIVEVHRSCLVEFAGRVV